MSVSRRRVVLSGLALFLVLLAVVVLFVPPPKPLLRRMMLASAPMLLEGPLPEESAVRRVTKRVVRAYMNVAVAKMLADRALERGGSDDVILGRMMAEVRSIVISPRGFEEIRHSTAVWPAIFSGVAYCDQINALVARMGAHHFDQAEIVALYLADGKPSPHTVGRVWSRERNDWLYFDAFYAQPVIFTRDAKGTPHFLTTYAGDFMVTREVVKPDIYELRGWTMADFRSTFGMYLFDRVISGKQEEVTGNEPPRERARVAHSAKGGMLAGRPAGIPTYVERPTGDRPMMRQPEVFRSVTKAYAAARVSHLFDGPNRNAYRSVARQSRAAAKDDRAAEIASAAARFAALPN